jgi:hypothetical protein
MDGGSAENAGAIFCRQKYPKALHRTSPVSIITFIYSAAAKLAVLKQRHLIPEKNQ